MRLDVPVPAIRTKKSRGIDRRAAWLVRGSTCTSTMVSLRCPDTSVAVPKCWAASADSFARLSEPTTRMFCGSPASAGSRPDTAMRGIFSSLPRT